jgi:Transposase and inactivated derivatives
VICQLGEIAMPKAYSYDLRVRVVDSVVKDGLSCRESAQRYHLVPSTVIRWVSHYRHSGSYATRNRQTSPIGIQPYHDCLVVYLNEDKNITLMQLCRRLDQEQGVRADPSMLSRYFHKRKITFKKNTARH